MSVAVKRILLDALIPREISIIELAKALGSVDEKGEVEIIVSEVDSKTESGPFLAILGTRMRARIASNSRFKHFPEAIISRVKSRQITLKATIFIHIFAT